MSLILSHSFKNTVSFDFVVIDEKPFSLVIFSFACNVFFFYLVTFKILKPLFTSNNFCFHYIFVSIFVVIDFSVQFQLEHLSVSENFSHYLFKYYFFPFFQLSCSESLKQFGFLILFDFLVLASCSSISLLRKILFMSLSYILSDFHKYITNDTSNLV